MNALRKLDDQRIKHLEEQKINPLSVIDKIYSLQDKNKNLNIFKML